MLKIYNTLTKQKTEFTPLDNNTVKLYVCGMTVYDYCHLGHARVLVAFDVITRYLRNKGYHVIYVRNITDIDDKIIHRAQENDEDLIELTTRFINAMDEDAQALHVIPPDLEPRATDHVDDMIAMIECLIKKGCAYVADNGDVYFDVSEFPDYGKLSRKDLDKLQTGVRIDVSEAKADPLDFALWKSAKPDEPSFTSPWGDGRPGWHIECSAMSCKHLGTHFDIHGGGPDLMFPHHENEIAQSVCATGDPFVETWMHVGTLQINQEKMSKSSGNFFTIRDTLEKYPAEVIRYFLLSSHYRSPLNFNEDNLQGAWEALERFYTALRDLPPVVIEAFKNPEDPFYEAMDDDFNTPVALAAMFDKVREINRLKSQNPAEAAELAVELKRQGAILGILQQEPDAFLHLTLASNAQEIAEIEELIAEREQARKSKDWARSDELRDELHALGVELEDTASGTSWRRKTP